jgi:sugar lactone lactonase YvrE
MMLVAGLCAIVIFAQKTETMKGVRLIHNNKGGLWGANPRISLRPVRTIDGAMTGDNNLVLIDPSDIAFDGNGCIYILDSGSFQVKKFDSKGNFLKGIGRNGQGPGEFSAPRSIDVDPKGRLLVADAGAREIQIMEPDGKETATAIFTKGIPEMVRFTKPGFFVVSERIGFQRVFAEGKDKNQPLPRLLRLYDWSGVERGDLGEGKDFGDEMLNTYGNMIEMDTDKEGNIVVTFRFQNRIEKYAPEGRIIWRADRVLNFETTPLDKGNAIASERGYSFQAPRMNTVSGGIATDVKGRIWVLTQNRQMKSEEESSEISAAGRRIAASPIIPKKDIYKVEIFTGDGDLLGEIPISHAASRLRIGNGCLFVLNAEEAIIHQYEITEK